jgi:nitrite reductase/ring-hydroxylating ferredoxin subunit
LSENFVKAILAAEIAPGGMKAIELSGRELVICNCDGSIHAIDRRCGHMNAPLEMGTLDGSILTCAMHCARFDVATGEALAGPVPPHLGNEPVPPRMGTFLQNVGMLMQHIRTESIHSHRVKVEAGWVWVELQPD